LKRFVILFVIFAFHTTFSQTITLRDTTNQYDYIIITVPEFVSVCEPFKQHKETVRDFRTLIVDTTQIFSEFDSSSTPQDNIRDFISYAGTFWKNPQPKYFLIAGSVQFVPNFNIPNPVSNSPYWQSDFYYKQNKYENDSTTTDFYVGRIPAKNTLELENYFSKVIEYESIPFLQGWMNNSLFICQGEEGFNFIGHSQSLAITLPSYMRSNIISSADTSVYYGNKDSICSAINNIGSSAVWFEGHSAESLFVSYDYFSLNDLEGFNNKSKYFISIHNTQFAIIDTNTNFANEMLYLKEAGSIGGICNIGLTYWGIQKSFQHTFAERLFNPSIGSLGEAVVLDSFSNIGIMWKMKLSNNLWADPSLKLKYDITVDVEDVKTETPTEFALHQNYPNPFNPSTKIIFVIPKSSFVSLKVYNVLGKEAATLVNEERSAGSYEVEFDASNLPSGVYFYRLQAVPNGRQAGFPSASSGQGFVETKKMILLR